VLLPPLPRPFSPPTHTPGLHLNAPLLPSLQRTPSTPPPVFLPLPTPALPPTFLPAVHPLPFAISPLPVTSVGTTPASLSPCPPSDPPVPPQHQTAFPIGTNLYTPYSCPLCCLAPSPDPRQSPPFLISSTYTPPWGPPLPYYQLSSVPPPPLSLVLQPPTFFALYHSASFITPLF
ncbi:unnamed protein product, partial [Closterium sp. NIES-54]